MLSLSGTNRLLTWHCSRETLGVGHQALAQLVPANVGWADKDNGALVSGAGVVERDLLVGEYLLGVRFVGRCRRIQRIAAMT